MRRQDIRLSRLASVSRALDFPDSRISCEYQLASPHRGLFEILRVGREDLPACHLLSENLDRAHFRKLPPQTLVVLLGRGQPHSVVRRSLARVAQDEDNLVLNVNRESESRVTAAL
jgi:hypothetical protein